MSSIEFTTSDIGLASYVLSTGSGKYRGIRRGESKAIFVFRSGPKPDVAAEFLGGAEAPAKTLLDALRSLRTQLGEVSRVNDFKNAMQDLKAIVYNI